jgi:hypothetical protein
MKRAGELLSIFLDEGLMKKAQGYSTLFSAWAKITQDCKIPQAADHSRIRELERCVLLIEADHPGWIQLLQTKQHRLLATAQRRFPDLTITGISFMLSREPIQGAVEPEAAADVEQAEQPTGAGTAPAVDRTAAVDPYAKITDKGLRETLKRLEQGLKGE